MEQKQNVEIVKLNMEGEICPYPLIEAIKKAKDIDKDLKTGKKTLQIIVDCLHATENIPAEFHKRGLISEIEKIGAAKWRIIIKAL